MCGPLKSATFPFLLHHQAMAGDIQHRQAMLRQVGKGSFPLGCVTLSQPGKLVFFLFPRGFRRCDACRLIGFPFFPIDGTHRLWGNLSRIIRVRSFLKISQTLAELSHAEGAIHGRCLHRNVAHKDDGPGTFFLETQTSSRQLLMQLGPRFRVFYDGVSAFLRDALRGFFAGGVFKIQSGLFRFSFSGDAPSREFTVFQHGVQSVFLCRPSLFVFDERKDFVRLPNVKTLMRLHNFSAFRIHSVDRNMQVIIVRVVVQSIDGLVFGKSHFFKKHIHHFLHLFPRWLFAFPPGKNPVRYRHGAVNRFSGKRNHFNFLPRMCGREKISPARAFDFFLWIPVMRMADVIHQIAYLP